MSEIKRIAGMNLLILILYMAIIHFTCKTDKEGMSVLIVSALAITLHIFILLINCILNFIHGHKANGRAYLLSVFLILVIGFSTCLGSASL